MSLPPYALTEEQFAAWCAARDLDETDETFAMYEAWLEDGPAPRFDSRAEERLDALDRMDLA
jgi:hypothetical protein